MNDFFLLKVICLHLIRIVNQLEEPLIIYCITHLSLMTLHSELMPYRTLSYSVYRINLDFVLWKPFHVFKKERNRQTVTKAPLQFVYTRAQKKIKATVN